MLPPNITTYRERALELEAERLTLIRYNTYIDIALICIAIIFISAIVICLILSLIENKTIILK